MNILVCGGRDFEDEDLLCYVLDEVHSQYGIMTLIEGDARGADRMAGQWARSRKIQNEKYPAEWEKYGKVAGPMRNQRMLDEGKPDLVVAFPGERGTRDMVNKAIEAGVEVLDLR